MWTEKRQLKISIEHSRITIKNLRQYLKHIVETKHYDLVEHTIHLIEYNQERQLAKENQLAVLIEKGKF